MWITTNFWKFLKKREYQTTIPASCKTNIHVKKQQLELEMEQQSGSRVGKEYVKAVYCLSPCLFNLYEAQAGIKIARRIITNFRYADDTTIMAESREELKSLLMKVKEESEKAGLTLNIQKMKIVASDPIT